ncbi:MAG: GNAT family N-acetyltransferase [Pseudomonadota bacterium]|uniref:Acetyltransferase, GNAT family n=1 Tax=hydrothermal vent metagenome TaxID=652676 RepID=A0A160TKN4_9ZZZZ
MIVTYRAPGPADAPALSAMARQAFVDSFTGLIDPEPLAVYLEQAYGPAGQMQRDLGDPAIDWRAAWLDGAPAGYIKLSAMTLPFDAAHPDAMELRQLYVVEACKGRGVADALTEWLIDTARSRGAPELYLAVFDHNQRAKRFYARHGFGEVGRCDFVTGPQVHDDRIWRRTL